MLIRPIIIALEHVEHSPSVHRALGTEQQCFERGARIVEFVSVNIIQFSNDYLSSSCDNS